MLSMVSLTQRQQFLHVAEQGQKIVTKGLILQALPYREGSAVRVGITASKKIGNAVNRNKAKRRLRSLIREVLFAQQEAWQETSYDYVLIARRDINKREYTALKKDLIYALHQVHAQ